MSRKNAYLITWSTYDRFNEVHVPYDDIGDDSAFIGFTAYYVNGRLARTKNRSDNSEIVIDRKKNNIFLTN